MRGVALLILPILVGCEADPGKSGEGDYNFLQSNHASSGELCAAAKKALQAAADRHDSTDYSIWRVRSDSHCLFGRGAEADEKTRGNDVNDALNAAASARNKQ